MLFSTSAGVSWGTGWSLLRILMLSWRWLSIDIVVHLSSLIGNSRAYLLTPWTNFKQRLDDVVFPRMGWACGTLSWDPWRPSTSMQRALRTTVTAMERWGQNIQSVSSWFQINLWKCNDFQAIRKDWWTNKNHDNDCSSIDWNFIFSRLIRHLVSKHFFIKLGAVQTHAALT